MNRQTGFTLTAMDSARLRTALVCSLLLVTATSCFTNNLNRSPADTSGLGAGNPLEGSGGGSGATLLRLTRVVKSNSDPSAILDLVGDGTGTIGNFCFAANGTQASGAGVGPSTCRCEFEYADGSLKPEFDTVLYESNLIRCRYDGLPADVREIKVRIKVTTTGVVSNQVKFKFSGTDDSLDLTDPASFYPVKRYQCRDKVSIQYMFDGSNVASGLITGMYDPLQSEHILYSYPLNYYTTNLGGAIAHFAARSATGAVTTYMARQECDFNDAAPAYWRNMNVYSLASDGGSRLIHPPDSSQIDRSTFYLARKPAGIMSVPVNALVAPATLSMSPDAQGNPVPGFPSPIGYAARPVSTPVGERCPSTVSIPENFRWVKIWNFRGNLPPRAFVGTTDEIREKYDMVACNPGRFTDSEWTVAPATSPTCSSDPSGARSITVFPDCLALESNIPDMHGAGCTAADEYKPICALRDVLNGESPDCDGLAARVLVDTNDVNKSVCVRTEPGGAHLLGNANFAEERVAPGRGTDVFLRYQAHDGKSSPKVTDVITVHDSGSTSDIGFGLQSASGSTSGDGDFMLISADNPSRSVANDSNPIDSFEMLNLDSESRADYLFVVTPQDVTRSQMINEANSSVDAFRPFTYKNGLAYWGCSASDPDADPDCQANQARKTAYKLQLQEIGAQPDSAEHYPLCAIQPCGEDGCDGE